MTAAARPKTSPTAAPNASDGRTPTRARRWAILAVLTASLLVLMMDMTILNIAIPEMSAELAPTADQLLWIVDVYSLVLAGLLVSWSAIADRWGRKRMLLLGYVIFGGVSLLVLWATTAEAVIALRALLGVGGAMIMPTTLSLIRVVFADPRERATALGIWAAVSSLGAAVGPLIGGFLLEHFSWHAAFLVNVPLMAVAFVAGALLLPESRVPNVGRWDWFSALLSFAGMTLFVWAIKAFGKAASVASFEGWLTMLIGVALLAWFSVRCLRRPHPLLELRLFRSRPFSAGIAAAFGSMFAMGAAFLLLAQWMQLVDGATPVEAGMRMLPAAVGAAIGSVLAPVSARWIGARAVLAGGIACAAIGFIAIGIQPGLLSQVTVLVSLWLIGIGSGALAIGSAMIMYETPEAKAGNAAAIEETAYELGSVLGVAVLGTIAALWYRAEFAATGFADAVSGAQAASAAESLGAANSLAESLARPDFASEAGIAFTHGLQAAGLIGGVLLLAIAIAAFCMTPKGLDVTAAHQ